MMRRNADTIFVALLLALLFGALFKTVFLPRDINVLENRYAQKLPKPSADGYLSGQMQDDTESALSDQFPFSKHLISGSNNVKNRTTLSLLSRIMKNDPDHYYTYGNEQFYHERLCYAPKALSDCANAISARAESLNSLFLQNSDVSFYAYFIENDANMNFETGQNCGICDAVLSALELPETQKSAFRLNGFEDFARDFYTTDHHWNDLGVQRGYREVSELLGLEPLCPEKTVTLENRLIGSKAKEIGAQDILSDKVSVSVYALPELEVSINGEPGTYGNEADFLSGRQQKTLTYASYYGSDDGEVIFRNTERPQAENLLIIGDSYDNALLKLLASHYHCTYAIDLRYYATFMGQAFRLSSYIEAHDINRVLFIGSTSFWILDDFALED